MKRAERNARIALRANRYIRQEMANAMTMKAIGDSLVSETETGCRPSDCPGQERPDEVCDRHGKYHTHILVRHCDADGSLVHLDVSTNHPVEDNL